MTSSDEDVPPLEDCTEMIEKANHLRESNHNKKASQPSQIAGNEKNGEGSAKVIERRDGDSTRKTVHSNKKSDFGGMKMGFLFGGAASKKKPHQEKAVDNLTLISPKQTKEEALRIPEVQESMKDALGFNKDWMTDDLLTKISKNEKLSKWLTDPRSTHILHEMQTNPTAAKEKYKDDPDVAQFFREFGQCMGTHFEQMANEKEEAEKRSQQVISRSQQGADIRPAADAMTERVMQNPEVREALMDPDVQRVIQALKEDPQNGDRIMRTADSKLRHHLGILLKSGVLGVQQA